jgi:hypothetical protein
LVDIDAEDNDKEEGEEEDDNIKELEPPSPPAVVRFISVWKIFNGKEVLPST